MIIGNKLSFAIELEIHEFNSGIIVIWVENQILGTREETFLMPNLNALKRIQDYSSFNELNFYTSTPNKIFKSILKNEQIYDRTLLGLGESFDLFEVRAYIFLSKVIFVWKVTRDIEVTGSINNYINGETYMGITDSKLYYSTIATANSILNTNKIEKG